MSRISTRPISVLSGEDAEQPRAPSSRSLSIYAALMRNGRKRRPLPLVDAWASATEDPVEISQPEWRNGPARPTAPHKQVTEEDRAFAEKMPSLLAPATMQIAMHTLQARRCIGQLADTIEQFCTDPAISDSGWWEVEINLDPNVLPDTTLHLQLSPFVLSLRFSARDSTTKQLIWEHREALKSELKKSMTKRNCARTIEIEVT
jgi:hypothetical protein